MTEESSYARCGVLHTPDGVAKQQDKTGTCLHSAHPIGFKCFAICSDDESFDIAGYRRNAQRNMSKFETSISVTVRLMALRSSQ